MGCADCKSHGKRSENESKESDAGRCRTVEKCTKV